MVGGEVIRDLEEIALADRQGRDLHEMGEGPVMVVGYGGPIGGQVGSAGFNIAVGAVDNYDIHDNPIAHFYRGIGGA